MIPNYLTSRLTKAKVQSQRSYDIGLYNEIALNASPASHAVQACRTRYDKLHVNCRGVVKLAALAIWLGIPALHTALSGAGSKEDCAHGLEKD